MQAHTRFSFDFLRKNLYMSFFFFIFVAEITTSFAKKNIIWFDNTKNTTFKLTLLTKN